MITDKLKALRVSDWRKTSKILNENFPDDRGVAPRCAAYVIAKSAITGGDLSTFESFLLSSFVRPQLAPVISKEIEKDWGKLYSLKDLDPEECAAYLLYDSSAYVRSAQTETPEGISRLAMNLLEIKPVDTVADFCTGRGGFIRECVLAGKYAMYQGNEIDESNRGIALMRSDILSGNITVTSENALMMNEDFDKIFCNHPFGLKCKDLEPECIHAASADWLFLNRVMECLAKKGKAVCIMTNGCTWNMSDREMRKSFVDMGVFEAIIALPSNIFEHTAVGAVMAVLSYGNRETMFVDATELYESGRRCRRLSDENIYKIINAVRRESVFSRKMSCDEIAENDYNLYPKTYTQYARQPECSVSFSDIIKRITRGAQIKAAELDTLVCSEKTSMKLLMLSDIQSGIISKNLLHLCSIDKRLEKYCVKDGDLIISKNGLPAKIAVAELEEGEKILVNGNLYIVEIDKEKADPYYIKAYFESEEGSAALESICVGVSMLNIPVEALKKLNIPLCSINKQKYIADVYKKRQNKVIALKEKLAEAEIEMKRAYNTEF